MSTSILHSPSGQEVAPAALEPAGKKKRKKKQIGEPEMQPLGLSLKKHYVLYLMVLPGIIYFLIFKYAPMGGLVIAFQDYKPFMGILESEFVGFEHFIRLFTEDTFMMLMRNTLIISALMIIFSFPIPIILALLLNEVRFMPFKKTVQTIIYLPHFMSWVIVVSIFYVLLSIDGGSVNNLIVAAGGDPIPFLTDSQWLRPMYIFQEVWKGAGWGTIVYLAAITSVDETLYEAARLDGAGRMRQTWHITLPAIRPTIVVMFILKIGDIMELGFEHMFLVMNSINREVAEIFDTYVYTAGIQNGQLSYSSAVGLFKGAVGLILVIMANKMAKKFGEEGVY